MIRKKKIKRRKKGSGRKSRKIIFSACLSLLALCAVWFLRPAQKIAAGAPNIIIICLDTLRADHLGCYGYRRDTTPNIDRLAAQGILFERTLSQSPWTLPAHVSLFTSLYPSRHGVHRHDLSISKREKLLASLLSRAGYATAGLVDVFLVSRKYGFQRGFDVFRDEGENKGAAVMVDQAIEWLGSGRADKPFFLFLHLYDPHSAYKAPVPFYGRWSGRYESDFEPDTEELFEVRNKRRELSSTELAYTIARYDEEVAYADSQLGRFFDCLRERGLYEDTVIAFLSDHGEEFLDHGGMLHGVSLYDELVLVPLVLRLPRGRLAGRRIAEQVQLIDVAPTLMELAGLAPPRSFQGISLVPYLEGGTRLKDYGGFSEADHMGPGHNVKRCLRTNNYKYYYDIRTKTAQLFDLRRDPGERVDLVSSRAQVAAVMQGKLFRWMESGGRDREVPRLALSPAEQQRLRSLGYLH